MSAVPERPGTVQAQEAPEVSRWEGMLPRLSLDRRITVAVLLISTVVVGLVAAAGIPLELFPRGFESPHLWVNVPWQDAPAREVLDKVVLPLEEELATVKGIDRISSFATTGRGRVSMTFKVGTDMDVAYREVRDRVQRARARLPEDADRLYIRKDDFAAVPISFVGLAIDPEVPDPYALIDTVVVLPLQRIDGVASVEIQGLEEKEVLIELDRQRTEASGLDVYRVARDLAGDNFTLASGSVRTGGKKLLLRSLARYRSLEEVAERPVAPGIRVADVATVSYAEPEKKYAIRVNSKPAVAVQVLKESEANTLEVCTAIAAAVERMRSDPRLARMEIDVLFDQGEAIDESLSMLVDSGMVGGVLSAAILFFFLRRVRMTLIINLAVPLSLLMALTVMFFAGETLNILTLLGLMICIGMLVDNSVVVAENVFRLHRAGLPRREAVIRGTGEIALAITLATLTTVIVFVPIALVEGQGQFFLRRLAIPVAFALLASLVVALVFIPLAMYFTLPSNGGSGRARGPVGRVHDRANAVLRRGYDATFGRLNDGYARLLAFFLGRRLDLVMALLVVIGVTGALAGWRELKVVDQDENDRAGFEIDVEVPPNYTFEDTRALFLDIEKVLEGKKDELGLEGYFFFHRVAWGEVEGWFPNPPATDLSVRQVLERVTAALPERAGVKYYTGDEDEDAEEDEATWTATLNGDDPDRLEQVAADLEKIFAGVEGVVGVRRSGERQPNELALVIDRDRAQRQGVDPEVVAGVVGYALRGLALPEFYSGGREIPVRVRFEEADREGLAELGGFAVPTASGGTVPLSALTDARFSSGEQQIRRLDKRLARTLTLDLEEGREDEIKKRLGTLQRAIDLPEGVSFGDGARRDAGQEDLANLGFAALLSVIFIYLLMGFLFESFVLPLSIVLTIPLAGIGVVLTHLATGRNLDALGMVGVVLLIGVVVNNGIVLIDYVNRLREEGHERGEAILLAAHRRFRPIMMTALTTILGLLPLTWTKTSSIGMSYKSFGYTLIGGLTTATFLTLLVVPVFYTLFDDMVAAFRRAWVGRRREKKVVAELPAGVAEAG